MLNRVDHYVLLDLMFFWLPYRRDFIVRLLKHGFFWFDSSRVFKALVYRGEHELAEAWIEGLKTHEAQEFKQYGLYQETLKYEKLLCFQTEDYRKEMLLRHREDEARRKQEQMEDGYAEESSEFNGKMKLVEIKSKWKMDMPKNRMNS